MLTPYFKVLFCLLILLPAQKAKAVDHKFYSINQHFGISMREANSVCKDDEGFIWGASKTGIIRISGDDYRLYQLPYETVNIISLELVYRNRQLYAFTNNGQVFMYDPVNDRFEIKMNLSRVLNDNHLSMTAMVLDETGVDGWLATTNGLYRMMNDSIRSVSDLSTTIYDMIGYGDRELILAEELQLKRFDKKSGQSYQLCELDAHLNGRVSDLFLDKASQRLWIGTLANGLFYFDLGEQKMQKLSVFPNQPIMAIECLTDSTLLVGVDGQGLWEIDRDNGTMLKVYKEDVDNPNSLNGNGVYDIFCDDQERVWISTYTGGIAYFDLNPGVVNQIAHVANQSQSLANNNVNDLIEDKRGRLWMATNNGISRFDPLIQQWDHFYVNEQEQAQVFLTLCEDNEGRIWAGSFSSGVYVLDSENGKQLEHYSQQVENSPFINDYVFDIFKDSGGDLWIGGINREVIRYQAAKDLFQKYSVQPIYVLDELKPGKMLFGCTYGLILSDNETGMTSPLVAGCLVHDVLVHDARVWIASSGEGLMLLDPDTGETEHFTVENGLPSNFVNSILFYDGYLWLGTENGLCRFDPVNKLAHVYTSVNLLSGTSFNRNAALKLKNGQLAWGTSAGVLVFDPAKLQEPAPAGEIFIQDITIAGRSVREMDEFDLKQPVNELQTVSLHYNKNTIALELLPLGAVSGARFSWKMEGIDEDWTSPASQRIVSYANIKGTENVLQIRMYDGSMNKLLAQRSLLIRVIPPFWATPWFLVILFLLISLVIYFVFWYYIGLLKQRHAEEKVRFFTNTAHDLRTALTLIKAPIDELNNEAQLSEKGRNNIALAGDQAHRLSAVVSQLMDFQKADVGKAQLQPVTCDLVKLVKQRIDSFKPLARKRRVDISFLVSENEFFTAVDVVKMEKIIDNLISNAVKYAFPETTIELVLKWNNTKWNLEVNDQGIGISKKAQQQLFREFYREENAVNARMVGSGIGLILVKNYVQLHGGSVSCESEQNKGSSFRIEIPCLKTENKATDQVPDELTASSHFSSDLYNQRLETYDRQAPGEFSILLVEDNDELLRFMQSNLADEFTVATATDGTAALEMIRKNMPDLVVSDVMMPGMDGFELCSNLKSSFDTSHIPVIMLTALSEKSDHLHGLGLGADDYLTKPFDMSLLRQKIRSMIHNRKRVSEKALKMIRGNDEGQLLDNELNDQFLKKMLKLAKENIANGAFNKEVFASQMNVSPSLLYKKVKALTNQSPSEFIRAVRMDAALELLQSGKYNVTEVSEMTGFSSIAYFSTVFKKHFGKSPTEV
ncbi:hybrid sensor histidine kinase/response regulator transcription factor [Roseimarinus sediminis]|uniref:hybrid sensor histidine kinase/response regulator transcription factor n=1 Tax=Roseimarinus sediminis TaxID=1610899 RepID=UPI003D1A686A